MVETPLLYKVCIKCNISKPLSEFPDDKNYKDNKKNTCKECIAKYKREYRIKNKEYILKKGKAYRDAHKEERVEYGELPLG